MTILVTGGSGFIGSHLVQSLAEITEVISIDLNPPEDPVSNAIFHQGDLGDTKIVLPLLEKHKVEAVCHAGWLGTPWSSMPEFDVPLNVARSTRFIAACEVAGVRRFVFISSGAVYGIASEFPTREVAPTLPVSSYGVSKLAVEKYLSLSRYMETVALRPTGVYGPGQSPLSHPSFINMLLWKALRGEQFAIFGNGWIAREPLFVDDLIEAIQTALVQEDIPATLNLSGRQIRTNLQLVEMAEQVLNARIKTQLAAPMETYIPWVQLDCQTAEKALGWKPRTDLADGMRRTAEWLRGLREDV